MNDDLISREDALEAYSDLYWIDERLLNFKTELDKVYDNIRAIPSAQPKQGEWIFHYRDKWMVKAECPKCHLRFQFPPRTIWKCCPMCETRMKGADGKK